MREYPQHVRCAVMVGTAPIGEKFPLHHARAGEDVVQKLIDDCERDPDCGGSFPSLRSDWKSLRASFDAGPVKAVYRDSTGVRRVQLERGPFFESLRSLLMTTPVQRRIPFVIHRAAKGDFQPFFGLVPPGAIVHSPLAEGVYLSVVCPEATLRIMADEIDAETAGTFAGRYRVDRQIAACEEWQATALPDEAMQPVSASIPTLLVAGGMDYVTPIAWAREVSSRLSDSRVVVVDHMAHYPDGLAHMECLDALIRAFLRAGTTVGLDASCVETMTPPPFVTK
jgi:pimeloyl-ACP methyl ester carboxylesterase